MPKASCTDAEFIEIWNRYGSATLVSRHLGISDRAVKSRRNSIQSRNKIVLKTFNNQSNCGKHSELAPHNPARHHIKLNDGMVVIFSDAHYYPGEASTAHRALVHFIEQFHPEVVVCNGDAFDGGSISRYPRIGWDNKPTVVQEIDAVKARLDEIEAVSKGKLIWTLGNHDARYETYLAAHSPQFEGIKGFCLKDHFPRWTPCWSNWIEADNDIPLVIKHFWKGGIHAGHNNTIGSGCHIATGHDHVLKVNPYSDYNGRRYGINTGMLSDPYGPQFVDYTQDNPVNWCSGFAVCTYKNGKLLPPELVQVWDAGVVTFRGALIDV